MTASARTGLDRKLEHALTAVRALQESRLVARPEPPLARPGKGIRIDPGRQLSTAAAILACSVLADSALEHYRGSFQNRAMYTPLGVAALTLASGAFGALDRKRSHHLARSVVYCAAAGTGIAGLGFHAYNVLKRPGRLSWINLFHGAPIGAPVALTLAGLLGAAAERIHARTPRPFRRPVGRALSALVALGLAGTVGEAGLLHFRGAFHNPAMALPVTLPPVAATLLGATAMKRGHLLRRLARWWLELTALLGIAGAGFHVYGISRAMGGWRNWSQNVLNGPPLPAPPSFTGLAIAGLAALTLMDHDDNE